MARPALTPKTRLNLEVSPTVRERLERLREETDADSLTEVVRKALALYELLQTYGARGSETFLRHPDGTEQKVLLV